MVAPLDWGLGHITRSIPIIENLLQRGHEVITCGNEVCKLIYEKEFKNLKHIYIEGYEPYYSSYNSQGWVMLKQLIKFKRIIKKERNFAEKITTQNNIDVIISDNRYGFRSNQTKNIFICHQIQLIAPPIIQTILRRINKSLIKKFDFCWIPDEKQNLSGKLSEYNNNHTFRIGNLSRFKEIIISNKQFTYEFLAVISGPEPQRKIIENKLIEAFQKQKSKCAIINGKLSKEQSKIKNIDFFSHQSKDDFIKLISETKTIICRSGYTSIMDLSVIQKEAILIPTPGQTEQEYLAKYHNKKSKIGFLYQNNFTLKNAKNLRGKIKKTSSSRKLLEEAIKKIEL